MADWNDLLRAFDNKTQKEADIAKENEQRLFKEIVVYVCNKKGSSPLQGYKPEDILEFLEKPLDEIRECLGGEWTSMEKDKLENLIYTLSKKVKKSGPLLFN
ncbi:MAG: hypothetical protein IJC59_06550 [Lachnospiraceae bacterium]|nr:hypothetical protein [Lachnospiraceae bacterium]